MTPFVFMLEELKQKIWIKCKRSLTLVNIAADKACVSLPITRVEDAQAILKAMEPKKKPAKPYVHQSIKDRYREAKYSYESTEFPTWIKDGHFIEPEFPNTETANGLQTFIINFLTWTFNFGNRTGNEGRVIVKNNETIRIKSSSKNGMQDIDTNLAHPDHKFGIPWKIEVKVGKDTHKDHQKEFGKLIQRTGGVYSVVRSAEDFIHQYDNLMEREVKNLSIFE